MVIGAFYGLAWSFVLAFRNWKKFSKDFNLRLKEHKNLRIAVMVACMSLLIASFLVNQNFLRIIIVFSSFFVFVMFYLSLFVKSIERTCMLNYVEPEQLTEGDWVAKDVIVNNKRIAGPKDLGIEKEQIKKLIEFKRKGLIKKILIKEGIPFVPSFLISFIITLVFGNWLLLFL